LPAAEIVQVSSAVGVWPFTFVHLARRAARIFLRAAADIVRFIDAEPVAFATLVVGLSPFEPLPIVLFGAPPFSGDEAADIVRVDRLPFRDVPEPFSDGITEIA
jgi:hypothetical protein